MVTVPQPGEKNWGPKLNQALADLVDVTDLETALAAERAAANATYATLAKRAINVQEYPYNIVADGVYRAANTTQLQAALDLADSSGRAVYLGAGTIITDTLTYRNQTLLGAGRTRTKLQGRPGQDVLRADSTLGTYDREEGSLLGLSIVVDDSTNASASFPDRNDGAGNAAGNAGLAYDFPNGTLPRLRMNKCVWRDVEFVSLSATQQNASCGFYGQIQPNLSRFYDVRFRGLAFGFWDDYPRTNLTSVEHFSDHCDFDGMYFSGCGKPLRRVNTDAERYGTLVFHSNTRGPIWQGVQSSSRGTCGRMDIGSLYVEQVPLGQAPLDFGNATDVTVEHGYIAGAHGTVVVSCSGSNIKNLYISTLNGTNTPPVLSVTGNRNRIETVLAGANASDFGARSLVSDTGYGNSVVLTRYYDGAAGGSRKPEALSFDGRALHERDAQSLLLGHTALFTSGNDLLVAPSSLAPIAYDPLGSSISQDTTADLGEKLTLLGTASGFYLQNMNGRNGFKVGQFLPATRIRVYVKAKVATAGTQLWEVTAGGVGKGSLTLSWTTAYAVQSFDIDLTGVSPSDALQLNVNNLAGGGVGPLDIAWIGFRPATKDLLLDVPTQTTAPATGAAAALPAAPAGYADVVINGVVRKVAYY